MFSGLIVSHSEYSVFFNSYSYFCLSEGVSAVKDVGESGVIPVEEFEEEEEWNDDDDDEDLHGQFNFGVDFGDEDEDEDEDEEDEDVGEGEGDVEEGERHRTRTKRFPKNVSSLSLLHFRSSLSAHS